MNVNAFIKRALYIWENYKKYTQENKINQKKIRLPSHRTETSYYPTEKRDRIQHLGRTTTLNEIQDRGYWILNIGNSQVCRVVDKGVPCKVFRGPLLHQKLSRPTRKQNLNRTIVYVLRSGSIRTFPNQRKNKKDGTEKIWRSFHMFY